MLIVSDQRLQHGKHDLPDRFLVRRVAESDDLQGMPFGESIGTLADSIAYWSAFVDSNHFRRMEYCLWRSILVSEKA